MARSKRRATDQVSDDGPGPGREGALEFGGRLDEERADVQPAWETIHWYLRGPLFESRMDVRGRSGAEGLAGYGLTLVGLCVGGLIALTSLPAGVMVLVAVCGMAVLRRRRIGRGAPRRRGRRSPRG